MGPDALRAAEGFDSEEDFCDRVLVPLLEEFGFRFQREHHLTIRVGSRDRTLYVDFLLYDTDGEGAALLEAKRNIRSDGELEEAPRLRRELHRMAGASEGKATR